MMQINLTGFLNGKNAREFMGELWPLLLSAQENIAGIPTAFLELKKEEIKQRQVGGLGLGMRCGVSWGLSQPTSGHTAPHPALGDPALVGWTQS